MRNKFFLVILLMLSLSSCKQISRDDERQISTMIAYKIDKDVNWQRSCGNPTLSTMIEEALCHELTADIVVQIALLNNPRIQELFWDVGIAQADLIEAGLFSNPIFEALIRYPNKKGFYSNPEISVAQNFIDFFMVPLKIRVAAAELEKIKFEVGNSILDLSFEVQKIYYKLVAAQKQRDLLISIIDLAEIANEIAAAQNNIANIYKLEWQLRKADYLQRTVELADIETEIIHLREELNRLMGLSGCEIYWSVSEILPPIPDDEPSLCCLESLAFWERLDLRATRWEVEHFRRSFPMSQWWAFTDFHIGASTAREPDPGSPWTTGPYFSGQIPIFNFGQAARRRFLAQYSQAQVRLAAIEIEIYAEVREARDKLLVRRNQLANYLNYILPNYEEIMTSTEELYNIMGTSIFNLLDKKRDQLTAQHHYQIALREYWLSRVDLDKALGGNLYLLCREDHQ